MRHWDITINCEPAAMPRHRSRIRWTGAGPKIHVHKPSGKGEAFRQACAIVAHEQFPEPVEGPVSLLVEFDMPRPKGHYGTGRNADRIKDSSPQYHTKKPDVDNMLKALLDGLVDGGAIKDDVQVVLVQAVKHYVGPDQGACRVRMRAMESAGAGRASA